MTNNFSNNTNSANVKATFTKHHVYEVASSLAESKQIADGFSRANRWQHRARVTIVGSPYIRPYDPIYLDGLPNGMSGYWTVLSVTHIFGGVPADYMVDLEVGTDLIGQTDSQAANRANARDVQGDLAGQSLVASDATLTSYNLSPNGSSLVASMGMTSSTSYTSSSIVATPSITGITPFKDVAPNLNTVKKTVQWTSTKSNRVVT